MLFIYTALMATLCVGSLSGVAWFGWFYLFYRSIQDIRVGILTAAFSAACFHPIWGDSLIIFSVKHYHVAMLFLIIAQIIHGKILKTARIFICLKRFFLIPIIMVGVGLLPRNGIFLSSKEVLFMINFLSVVLGAVYFAASAIENKTDYGEIVSFFLCAIAAQLGVNVINHIYGLKFLGLDLMYNNQFAMLLVFGLILSVYLFVRNYFRFSAGMLLLVFFSGVVLACSRTAWWSLLSGCLFGTVVYLSFLRKGGSNYFLIKKIIPVAIVGILLFVLLYSGVYSVRERVNALSQIFNPEYITYTFQDRQNFGFLGILRLEQLYQIKNIFAEYPLFGMGWAKVVTDFHGFLFVLLGGSGVLGVALFLYYVIRYYAVVLVGSFSQNSRDKQWLALCLLTFLFCWLVSSLTQSMYVHYAVWFNFALAMAVTESYKREKKRW